MHPTAATALTRPRSLRAQALRIVSIDCSLAMSMNPQVLTTTTSALSTSLVTLAPADTSAAIMCSESTVFLSQPSVTTPRRGPSSGPSSKERGSTACTAGSTPGLTGSEATGNTGSSRVRSLIGPPNRRATVPVAREAAAAVARERVLPPAPRR